MNVILKSMLAINKLVCIVGMSKAGKSKVADIFGGRRFPFIRFGQIAFDNLKGEIRNHTKQRREKQ